MAHTGNTAPLPIGARILVVGVEKPLFDRIEPLLSRSRFGLERVPRGASGAALASHAGFELLIVRHPLPDLALGELLRSLRQPGSPSAGAHILVLAEEAGQEEARRQAPGELVLSVGQPVRLLEEVAARLLGVAPRVTTRLLVRLDVRLPEGKSLLMCQSENLSEAGMLLRAPRAYPLGTRLAFEMAFPGGHAPLQGEAEVVRHAVADVEKVEGVGVRFMALKEDALEQIRDFVARSLPPERRARKPVVPAVSVFTQPPPTPSSSSAIEGPVAVETRDRHRCQSCQGHFVVVYQTEPDEGQETVAVACPHCWQRTAVLVAEAASDTGDFRAEKVDS